MTSISSELALFIEPEDTSNLAARRDLRHRVLMKSKVFRLGTHAVWCIAALATTGCTCSTPGKSDASPIASSASSEREPRWADCKVLGDDNALIVSCSDKRIVSRLRLPEISEKYFDLNAKRFFENADRAGRTPSRETITLRDGRRALAAKLEAATVSPIRSRKARWTTVPSSIDRSTSVSLVRTYRH